MSEPQMSNFAKHVVYWILPSLFVGICMGIYFFDIGGMSYLVAPTYNREFGIVENAQLIIILAIAFVCYKMFQKALTKPEKIVLLILFFGSVFLFLEEIDYGLHYYDYFVGKTKPQLDVESWTNGSIRNIHNQGSLTGYIKLSAYVILVFVAVASAVLVKLDNPPGVLVKFAPQHYMIYTLLSMAMLNRAARYIEKNVKSDEITSLNSNTSEFEEVFIYYIVLLYLLEKGGSFSGWTTNNSAADGRA